MAGPADGEIEALLRLLPRWARARPDVRAIALVGSWARGDPGPDSDLDLVLLSDEPGLYADAEDWARELGGAGPVKTRPWGAITERRFALPGGLEVEVGVGRPSWASVAPLDPGTRRVAGDGLKPLHDPDGLLAALVERCPRRTRGGRNG
ncbi:MAG: nucleotidyltransferase domain-containing protein [Solirubrobacterales bacterium]